jgi:hypothetical protein
MTWRVTSPLFGAKLLALLVVGAVVSCNMISHSLGPFVLSYILAGLMLFGVIAQAISVIWLKTLRGKEQVVWWVASTVYGLWLAAASAALFRS